MSNKNERIIFHPSYYIKEYLEEIQMTQDEFAKRLGITGKQVSLILQEKASVTPETALKLSTLLGTSIELWLNLQAKYDALKALEEKEEQLEEEKKIYKMIDKKFLLQLNIINKEDKIDTAVGKLRFASKVSSLTLHCNKDIYCFYRASTAKEETIENIVCRNVWVSLASEYAKEQEVKSFDEKMLLDSIPLLRSMTTMNPDEFFPRMKQILANCGVSLVVLPALKKSKINGAVKWYDSNKVMMALNTRGSYNDRFWFSFFHELKHVLQKNKRKLIINEEYENCVDGLCEYEADLFAKNILVPQEEIDKLYGYTEKAIMYLAKSINIHPGIVVGRLQNEGKIEHSRFNELKVKYEIKVDDKIRGVDLYE